MFRISARLAITIAFAIITSHAAEIHGPFVVWTKDPSSTAMIQWLNAPTEALDTPDTGKTILRYRKLKASSWNQGVIDVSPFADTANTVSRVELTRLDPDTTYEIQLTPGGSTASITRTLRTASRTLTPDFHFVSGGDMYHTRDLLDRMNAQAGAQSPLFALLGGDLAYANGRDEKRWINWIDSWAENAVFQDPDIDTKRMIPMIVTIGNHEVAGKLQPRKKTDAKFFYSLFLLPDDLSRYAIDFGNYLSIILLDSDHTQPVAEQTDWLEKALIERDHFPYLFVCYHKPTYGTSVKKPNKNIRKEWVPLFEKHRVDLVFENDHHIYKRSKLLYKNREDHTFGVLYIGDGAWGVKTRKIDDKKTKKLGYLEHWQRTNHLISVRLSPKEICIEPTMADGTIFDETTLPLRRAR